MFRQTTNSNLQNPSMIPNQGTYPPYMNFNDYQENIPNQNPQYAESIFSLNKGKKVTVFFSYPDSIEWRDRVFTGTILADGRDYLLLQQDDGKIILLWLVYINYAVFNETASY